MKEFLVFRCCNHKMDKPYPARGASQRKCADRDNNKKRKLEDRGPVEVKHERVSTRNIQKRSRVLESLPVTNPLKTNKVKSLRKMCVGKENKPFMNKKTNVHFVDSQKVPRIKDLIVRNRNLVVTSYDVRRDEFEEESSSCKADSGCYDEQCIRPKPSCVEVCDNGSVATDVNDIVNSILGNVLMKVTEYSGSAGRRQDLDVITVTKEITNSHEENGDVEEDMFDNREGNCKIDSDPITNYEGGINVPTLLGNEGDFNKNNRVNDHTHADENVGNVQSDARPDYEKDDALSHPSTGHILDSIELPSLSSNQNNDALNSHQGKGDVDQDMFNNWEGNCEIDSVFISND